MRFSYIYILLAGILFNQSNRETNIHIEWLVSYQVLIELKTLPFKKRKSDSERRKRGLTRVPVADLRDTQHEEATYLLTR
jgi:hypothetical protein